MSAEHPTILKLRRSLGDAPLTEELQVALWSLGLAIDDSKMGVLLSMLIERQLSEYAAHADLMRGYVVGLYKAGVVVMGFRQAEHVTNIH